MLDYSEFKLDCSGFKVGDVYVSNTSGSGEVPSRGDLVMYLSLVETTSWKQTILLNLTKCCLSFEARHMLAYDGAYKVIIKVE